MQNVLARANLTRKPRELLREVIAGLAKLYGASPGLHRVLVIEGLRVAKADRVLAFDARVIGIIRNSLEAMEPPIRRRNAQAAAFVAFQSVRATMLASLLSDKPGLEEQTVVDELVDLVLQYLVGPGGSNGQEGR